MPPIIPIGSLKGIKAIDAMGTGLPKQRGPQGPANLGDAGLGSFQLPEIQVPQINMPQINPMQQQDDPGEAMAATLPVAERPPMAHPKSVNGWLKNLAEDIYQFAAAIPASFKIAAQSGAEIAKNWRYLDDIFINHPELIGRELDTTARQVIKGFTDTYEHGLGEALYKHPFSVLLDLTGVFDIAGAGIKGLAKGALKAGSKDAAASLTRLGTSIQTMPGRVIKAPFVKGLELFEKVPQTQKLMQNYALSKLGREEAAALGKYQTGERAIMEPIAKELFKRKIAKKDWALFDDLLDGMVPRSQIKDAAMLERYDEWQKMIRGDEVKWRELGVLTDDEMTKAALKQTALKLKEKGIFKGELYKYEPDKLTGELKISGFTDEAYEAANRWASGDNPFKEAMRPTYKPFVHERSFSIDDLFDALSAGEKSDAYRKWWSRMEQRTGVKPHTLDPDIWQARSMLQKAEILGTLKYYDDAIKRHGKPIKIGGKADPGYVIVPPMLQRYVKNGLPNAMDKLLQNAVEAIENARLVKADRAQALKQGIVKTYDDLMRDAERILDDDLKGAMKNPAEYAVQVPKEVAYMMQKSMVGPKGMWKFYDDVLNTWRDAILTFMPRYYINNLLGNAVMLMFAGHTPFNKVAALKEADLPGEVLGSILAQEAGGASSFISKAGDAIAPGLHKNVRRGTNYLADVSDQRAKQIALGTLSKDVIAREAALGNVTAQGLVALDKAEAAAKIFQARKDLILNQLDELQETKKAFRSAGGDFEVLRKGIVGRKNYTMQERRTLNPMQQSQADAITKEMMELQRKIQHERQLSNMSPDIAKQRITELEQQLSMKAKQLEQIDPNLTIGGQMGQQIDRMPEINKIAEIQARRKALQPYADLAEKTVLEMEKFFGNYGRLHPIEREYIRRVIPFWTFSKTMFQLAFNLPFLRPKTSFLWHQFAKLMMDSIGDDRLPNRYRNMVPIGGDEEGNVIFMKIAGFNPFEQVSKLSSVGGVPIPQFMDPRNNPLVKIAVESIGGYDLFTEKPFVKPTDFVSLNGSVKRYDPDLQRIETIIPQKPIIDSVLQQIPHMRILAELVQSAGLSSDYLGVETPRNPDGTLTYNRQMWHALMRAAGFPITTQNPEKVKLQHELLRRGMAKRFRSASGRVDPETRLQLESILRDLERAEVYE